MNDTLTIAEKWANAKNRVINVPSKIASNFRELTLEGTLIAYNEWFQLIIICSNFRELQNLFDYFIEFKKPYFENENGEYIFKVKVPQELRRQNFDDIIGHKLIIKTLNVKYDFTPLNGDFVDDRVIGFYLKYQSLDDLGVDEVDE